MSLTEGDPRASACDSHPKKNFIGMEKYLTLDENQGHVDTLLNHERTAMISKDGNAYVYKNKKYKGFTRLLKAQFYPHYDGVKRRRNGRSSRKNGTMVHRQLYHMIECMRRKKGLCDCKIKTNPKRLNKYTNQALSKMTELGITPKASEVHILNKLASRCTSLDIIGTRWGKRSVIISIKTGYACGYEKNLTNQCMKLPLEEIPCTEQNQNLLQSMLETITLEKEYKLKFDDYILIYLGQGPKGEAQEEYLPQWCLNSDLREKVYQTFAGKSVK